MFDFDSLGEDVSTGGNLLGSSQGPFYRVVHKRIAVRDEPSLTARIILALVYGDVIHADLVSESGWVRLAHDEAWVHEQESGYVLVDGAQLGLGRLLERLRDEEVTEDTWPYALALRRAAALGVPFRFDQKQIRPMGMKRLMQRWLSTWHEPGTLEPVQWLPASPLPLRPLARPRLCVALLVRGIGAGPIESFIRYHRAIGFGRVAIFFDAPLDPSEAEAVAAARACAARAGAGEIQVHLCTGEWWVEEARESRFHARRDWRDKVYRETLELHEDVHDVQARQCLAVERAIREAHRDGFEWLLHIDSDELLLLPRHRDAGRFFASVPPDVDQVVFSNLEAVPEVFDVADWFREVSLFKVHQSLLQEAQSEWGDDTSSKGLARRRRLEQWRQRKIAKGCDPEDFKDNRSFDALLLGLRMVRRESEFKFDFDLPSLDSDSDPMPESDGESRESSKDKARRNCLPCYYTAYSNGKAACRLRRGVPPPLPVGVHRCTSDRNVKLSSLRCKGPGAPVVLHYANCGFGAWRRKYELLSRGHGTEDGGFSLARAGVASLRAHLAHRELLRRASEEQLRAYYRAYVMCSEFGELAHLACHGLVVRTHAVQALLAA